MIGCGCSEERWAEIAVILWFGKSDCWEIGYRILKIGRSQEEHKM